MSAKAPADVNSIRPEIGTPGRIECAHARRTRHFGRHVGSSNTGCSYLRGFLCDRRRVAADDSSSRPRIDAHRRRFRRLARLLSGPRRRRGSRRRRWSASGCRSRDLLGRIGDGGNSGNRRRLRKGGRMTRLDFAPALASSCPAVARSRTLANSLRTRRLPRQGSLPRSRRPVRRRVATGP